MPFWISRSCRTLPTSDRQCLVGIGIPPSLLRDRDFRKSANQRVRTTCAAFSETRKRSEGSLYPQIAFSIKHQTAIVDLSVLPHPSNFRPPVPRCNRDPSPALRDRDFRKSVNQRVRTTCAAFLKPGSGAKGPYGLLPRAPDCRCGSLGTPPFELQTASASLQ